MSYRYSSSSDSRRHQGSSSRRDSSSRDRDRHRSRRSPSPGPSRSRRSASPRDPKSLPESFGRSQESPRVEDDLNVLQRMKSGYKDGPLEDLTDCVDQKRKVKVWTRNYKEIRGVMTGFIVAFDKHWNLILRDVDEVYLLPKKIKAPFLRSVAANENLPDIPVKVPKEKKADAPAPVPTATDPSKKKRRKKAKSSSQKRHSKKIFIRGDNVVMVCALDIVDEAYTESESEEERDRDRDRDRDSG